MQNKNIELNKILEKLLSIEKQLNMCKKLINQLNI